MAIIAASVVGWFLFPDNLALLTRIIAIALLVLSLDLVTGYCGIATLAMPPFSVRAHMARALQPPISA